MCSAKTWLLLGAYHKVVVFTGRDQQEAVENQGSNSGQMLTCNFHLSELRLEGTCLTMWACFACNAAQHSNIVVLDVVGTHGLRTEIR